MSKLISKQISPFAKSKMSNSEKNKKIIISEVTFNRNLAALNVSELTHKSERHEIIFNKGNGYFSKTDIFYKNFEKSLLESKISDYSIKKLEKKITKIVSKIDNSNKNILIVGNIQSGKTNSFLGVMSKVFDKNINLAFVLGGTDKEICSQNYSRIKNLFNNSYIINHVQVYQSDDIKSNFNNERSIEEELIKNLKNGKRIVIVSIKNWKTINKWNTILGNIKEHIISSIVIDDEADQFTLNDIKKSINNDRTATNREIVDTLDILDKKTTLIQVTATPYAYIMIGNDDRLKPDYPFLIDRGVGYTSLSHFISNDNLERDNVLNTISDQEIINFKEQNVFGESFYQSILLHVIHSIFFFEWAQTKDIKDVVPKMLINPGIRKEYHQTAKEAVEDRIERILNNIDAQKEQTIKFIKETLRNYNRYLESSEEGARGDISLDELISEIKKELTKENTNIQVVNAGTAIEESNKKFTFYIGCNKLSRGITIPSLITTYSFARTKLKSNSDTVSQAARWLGYRELYKYFLTIYLSNDLLFDYDSIDFTNEDLYNLLSTYEENGETIKNLPRQILIRRDNALIRPTRQTVAIQKETMLDENENIEKMASKKSFFISKSWNDSEHDKMVSEDLEKIFSEYFEPYFRGSSLKLNDISSSNKLSHHKYISFDNIDEIENLLGAKKFDKMIKSLELSSELFNKIRERNSSKKVILSLMENKGDSNFYSRIYSNQNITTIPVGNRKYPASRIYVGDKYWFDDLKSKDYIIFQIYPIILKRNNIKDMSPIYKLALVQDVNQYQQKNNNSNVYIIESFLQTPH